MARRRPAVLTVMGILNIVLGSLFLLCNLCGSAVYLFLLSNAGKGGLLQGKDNPQLAMMAELWAFLQADVPGFAAVRVTEMVVSLVASVLLIMAGIGLLNVKGWGRGLSIAYSIIAILETIGSLAYTIAVVNPATERFMQGRGLGQQATNSSLDNIMSVVGAIISVAYAVVLLIMMLLPSVSAALSGPPRADEYDLERRDELDDDLERERRRREEWPE